jgi:biopolymer transport protein ExbD
MNLRGRNKVSAEFNMSYDRYCFLITHILYADINMVTTNALDLAAKSKGKTDSNKNIAVSINKELQFFIDKEPVSETELESKLLAMLANDKTKAIILRAEEGYQLKRQSTS